MHGSPVTALPDSNGVERLNNFFAGHGQYFALSGITQRTPPLGSGKSPS